MSDTQVNVETAPTNSMVTVRLSDVQIHPEEPPPVQSESTRSSVSSHVSHCSSPPTESETSSIKSVDWEGLDKTEEEEARVEGTDECTALLLARLEQENAALVGNPKSGLPTREQTSTRPPSIQHLKKLVNGLHRQSIRYSLLPAPPMTELEFWAALVSDYSSTAQRLPTLTSNKIRGGIPPPLRGVVWPSVAGARDGQLHENFQKLCSETSPYEGLIGKDVGRSFPNVEMFKDRDGEGQQMLGRVLKCFSLYDEKIGYCQGLGFVVGPLLMHMTDVEAFCVLVKLMEHYDLRSCYLPDLSGLHLRIYQYQALLNRHLPELAAHLEYLKIEPLYVSQWFLSFFAVTCPLPMLLRIYDVILAEGATETLMRVALSLMQRNEKKIRAFTEFEDAMQFLLSRALWDTYALHADDLVTDFVSLTGLVTRESLQDLERGFKESQTSVTPQSLKSTASQLLGRFWAGSAHSFSKSASGLSLTIPGSSIRKTSSGQSLTSTAASVESTSDLSTLATDVSETSKKPESIADQASSALDSTTVNFTDRDLHHQIEELLTALSDMQRQQIDLARDLQREREEREEERAVARLLLDSLRTQTTAIRDLVANDGEEDPSPEDLALSDLIDRASISFSGDVNKRASILQSKHQLRDVAAEWKEKHDLESARRQELSKLLDDRENEQTTIREQLREARARIQEAHQKNQRLERTIQDFRSRKPSMPDSPSDLYSPVTENSSPNVVTPARPGLREFKLGRSDTSSTLSGSSNSKTASISATVFSKRTSSLNTQGVLSTENHQALDEEALLLELVNAKTAEAVARQELEETKGKLDALRRIVSGPMSTPGLNSSSPGGLIPSPVNEVDVSKSRTVDKEKDKEKDKSPVDVTAGPPVPPKPAAPATTGGFFSSWGKRAT